uniref:DUF4283 domain-containing protein n=1 Tax=Cannabis sativa TaxID=3483 RepID=A0A803P499_CANSA
MDPFINRMKSTISLTNDERSLVALIDDGDKIRVLDKEPWHFQGHHIVLFSPSALNTVTSHQMIFTPFWVQAYRLPFLSESQSLAKALGNLIGEFLEVFQDFCFEGWGPFLRFRVYMDITKPLL